MMALILWLTTALLVLNAAQSYILLTANLDDVQSIAKQLAESPVAGQLKKIWRRAYHLFNDQVAKAKETDYRQRADDGQDENSVVDLTQREDSEQEEGRVERRQADKFGSVDVNGSVYISPTQKVEDT